LRAVWSFWSKPFNARRGSVWLSEKLQFLSWILSVETARKHYPVTSLYTDEEGARIADMIGIKFDRVSTELNALQAYDPEWWALGKLYTYRAQTEPFIHIDNDVFLWKRLAVTVEQAPVFAQCPEHFSSGMNGYNPDEVEDTLNTFNGWIPDEWRWYRSLGPARRGENCGIFGGNSLDFINHYADLAMRMIEHPSNQPGWAMKGKNIVLMEQYLLSACIEYYRNRQELPFHGIHSQYIFDSFNDAFDRAKAAQAGFTHLLGGAKKNISIARRIEKRVMEEYPKLYERCAQYVMIRDQEVNRFQ